MTRHFQSVFIYGVLLLVAYLAYLGVISSLNIPAMGAVVQPAAHADGRHGAEADMARECSQRPEQTFYNQQTKRTAYMCITGGFYGFHIISSNGDEVTAFLKNKMKNFDQVLRYMKNSGYELLH